MDILISACLLGIKCRYDGKDNYIENFFEKYKDINFIKICPEVDAGMPIPRTPCEIRKNKVFDKNGKETTHFFKKGAEIALKIAKEKNIKIAILKAKSPSCGKDIIYDGTFTRTLTNNDGLTAKLLKNNNIKIFTEKELNLFEIYLESLKKG